LVQKKKKQKKNRENSTEDSTNVPDSTESIAVQDDTDKTKNTCYKSGISSFSNNPKCFLSWSWKQFDFFQENGSMSRNTKKAEDVVAFVCVFYDLCGF